LSSSGGKERLWKGKKVKGTNGLKKKKKKRTRNTSQALVGHLTIRGRRI